MSRIDRAIARGEHHQERGLRAFQAEHHRVRIGRLDVLDVRVPVLAGVDAELGRRVRRLAEHVEGELDVLRRERLAVVPLDVLPEKKDEVLVVVLPRPPLGEVAHDGVHALRRLPRIEEDEVVEARQGREARRVRGRLVDGEALRQVLAEHHVEGAADLRSLRRRQRDRGHDQGDGEGRSQREGGETETLHCVPLP
jgi:hypothetical protein